MSKIMYFRIYPSWVSSELHNWSRWCWQGEYPHPMPAKCMGIERFYKRKTEEGDDDYQSPIQPNTQNALIVQEVWERLPKGPKLVLRAEYPQRHAPKPAMSTSEYKAHLSNAVYRVMLAFEGEL